jgi:type III pantothenate kinase
MLLAIDVGNTQTVIGVFSEVEPPEDLTKREPGELPGLTHHWRISTVATRTADEHALILRDLLAHVGIEIGPEGPIEGIALSSSVPPVTGVLREMVDRWFGLPLVVIQPGIRTEMPILYESPREVGADRIVNAVAALDLYGCPAIVVDLGTATTFDAISAGGEYLGGAIVPGVEISLDALVAHASALRRVELTGPRRAIGRTTVESIQSGTVLGFGALVDGLCRKIEEELGTATVIATGGLAGLISPFATRVDVHEPWLTLHGLRLLYNRNLPGGRPE